MEYAHNDDFVRSGQIVIGIVAEKGDAKARRKMVAPRPGKRMVAQRQEGRAQPPDKLCRGPLGGFGCDIGPNLREIGLRRFGQAERERPANAFFPRLTMRSTSKSRTRPAATSASPLSISAFKRANS